MTEKEMDLSGEKLAVGDFSLGKTLGTGAFGRVRFVTHKGNGRHYALKTLKKAAIIKMKQVDHIMSEKQILAKLQHPFIVNMFGSFHDPRYIYMVLEYIVGGEFFTHLRKAGRFENEQSLFYAAQITCIFEYCHELNIVYRDLKPENILINADGYVKLTDFGFAKVIEHRTYTLCGTPEYIAPEVLLNKGHGKPVDWWTLGILIYEMIVGYPPFVDEDPMGIYQKILAGKITFPKIFHKEAKSLVKKLLTPDLGKRFGNLKNGAADIKEHKWFKDLSWEDLVAKKIEAPFKPAVKGATDTSNFDDYPDSDQEPPAVNASQDPFTNWRCAEECYQLLAFGSGYCLVIATQQGQGLRALGYRDAYLRTCSSSYTTKSLDRMVHLNNDAVQKQGEEYGKFESGNKLSLEEFQKFLDEHHQVRKISVRDDLMPKCHSLMGDAIRSAASKLNPRKIKHCFEVFGFDFMVDSDFRVWLIECNANPCLDLCSAYLAHLIPSMLDQALRLTVDSFVDGEECSPEDTKWDLLYDSEEAPNSMSSTWMEELPLGFTLPMLGTQILGRKPKKGTKKMAAPPRETALAEEDAKAPAVNEQLDGLTSCAENDGCDGKSQLVLPVLMSLSTQQAFDVLKNFEENANSVRDPTAYAIGTARKAERGETIGTGRKASVTVSEAPRLRAPRAKGEGRPPEPIGSFGKSGKPSRAPPQHNSESRIRRQVQWLNRNAELQSDLDEERVVSQLTRVSDREAMDILKRREPFSAHPTAVPGPRPVVSFSVPKMALDPPVAPPPGMEDMHYDMARDIGQRVEALILDVTGTIWDGTAEWAGCGFYESYGARCYFCHVPSYLKSQHPN
ncbi:unnamed protein product [Cladocopium goreaui]|uniref:Uncharacterized protein n=1 Tax=Cladocopium goreaui TaxID=2562237 RepID=A0A9P1M3K0_9DINO|nr:unnamed protein product [Cladocopium goreaui]